MRISGALLIALTLSGVCVDGSEAPLDERAKPFLFNRQHVATQIEERAVADKSAEPRIGILDVQASSARRRAVSPTPVVASVEIALASDLIIAGAITEVARAITRTANGDVLIGRSITWTTTAPAVAAVDAAGRINAKKAGQAELVAVVDGKTAHATLTVEPRTKYERRLTDQWWFIDSSDPRMPAFDLSRHGHVPQPRDLREQIVIDETFSVPAGREVLWDNKIVWVRPKARQNIEVFGTLTVHNSLLLWDQSEHFQTRLVVHRGGTLRIENSYAFSSNPFWVNWEYEDGAAVSLDHYQGNPWTVIHDSVMYTAVNASSVTMTLLGETHDASVNVTDAHNVWLELFPLPGTYDLTLPRTFSWQDWRLPGFWPNTTVNISNSWLFQRDIAVNNGVNMTVRDTPDGFGLGWTMHKDTSGYVDCEIRGLGNPADRNVGTYYENSTWTLPCTNSSLTLKNSRLLLSWPNVYGPVRLKVYNSNLADVRNYGSWIASAPTYYEIYDSAVTLLSDIGGLMYVQNSTVDLDVQVNGQGSVIYGYKLRSADGSPLKVYQESGGNYIELQSPGPPWR